jgi:hypothetical protein
MDLAAGVNSVFYVASATTPSCVYATPLPVYPPVREFLHTEKMPRDAGAIIGIQGAGAARIHQRQLIPEAAMHLVGSVLNGLEQCIRHQPITADRSYGLTTLIFG